MLQRALRRIPTLQPDQRRVATTIITVTSGPLLGLCIALTKFTSPQPDWRWGLGAACVYVAAVGAVLIVNRRGLYNQKAIEGMLATLIQQLAIDGECDPRWCVWAPSPRGQRETLAQVTNYLPAKQRSGKRVVGRTLPKSVGLTGQVFRTGEAGLNSLPEDRFPKQEDLIRHHIGWGFDRQESEALAPERRTQLAAPIKGTDGEVLGVIYADSRTADGLTAEHQILAEVFAPFFAQALLMEGE